MVCDGGGMVVCDGVVCHGGGGMVVCHGLRCWYVLVVLTIMMWMSDVCFPSLLFQQQLSFIVSSSTSPVTPLFFCVCSMHSASSSRLGVQLCCCCHQSFVLILVVAFIVSYF
eukprot:m.145248 g.145248  ORF g.145248 m.145248 type:complete len:112 (+) comp30430_c0_seq1:1593-1928(+)